MFNFNPGEVPATKSSMEFVASLIAVVANPALASQHLAEMKQALDQIVEQHAAMLTRGAEIEAANEADAKKLDVQQADLEVRESELADIAKATANAEAQKAAAEQAEISLANKQKELSDREDAVSHREASAVDVQKQLDTWRAALDVRQNKLNADEANYAARMEKLKALAG